MSRTLEAAPAELRVLIVDDERLAREKLKRFLSESEGVRVVGEAANGRRAIERIRDQKPDVVFLDIQMPGMDGFEMLEELPGEALPSIVFVTAHDEYALRAFQVEAIDYLLKPFDRSRLEQALERVRRQLRADPRDILERVRRLLAEVGHGRHGPQRIAIRSAGRLQSLRVDEIDWFEGADNYVRIHTGKETHLIRETLSLLGGRLDPDRFVRIHRSTIVRLASIREVESLFHGDYQVVLRTGERLAVGRTHRGRLFRAMGHRP